METEKIFTFSASFRASSNLWHGVVSKLRGDQKQLNPLREEQRARRSIREEDGVGVILLNTKSVKGVGLLKFLQSEELISLLFVLQGLFSGHGGGRGRNA